MAATAHHALMVESSCVFCRIIRGEASAGIVARQDGMIAFLDTRPVFAGHCLVVPTTHVPEWGDLADDQVGPLFVFARRIGVALERSVGSEGAFIALNDRVSQSVEHVHVHVIPRRRRDGLKGFFWPRQRYGSEEEMSRLAEMIGKAVEETGDRGQGTGDRK